MSNFRVLLQTESGTTIGTFNSNHVELTPQSLTATWQIPRATIPVVTATKARRKGGRPKGSKNRPKTNGHAETVATA